MHQEGYLPGAIAAREVAEAVAVHKNAFFAEKDANGNRIDYLEVVRGGITLVPTGNAYDALLVDYRRMVQEGLFVEEPESFEQTMTNCALIQEELNLSPRDSNS